MESLERRSFLGTTAAVGTVALAGCGGGGSADVVLKYTSETRFSDRVPQEVFHDIQNPPGYDVFVVEFVVTKGSLPATDLLAKTHMDVANRSFDPAMVEISAPDQQFLTSTDAEYTMEAGTRGALYIPFDEDLPDNPKFRKKSLENSGVAMTEVDALPTTSG